MVKVVVERGKQLGESAEVVYLPQEELVEGDSFQTDGRFLKIYKDDPRKLVKIYNEHEWKSAEIVQEEK